MTIKHIFCVAVCFLTFTQSYTQNNFALSVQYGSGSSAWAIKPIEVDYHDTFGNVDTTVILYTTGSSSCIVFQISALYEIKRAQIGVSVGAEHFYLRNFITDGIPSLGIPTVIGPVANPTPTHFKFGLLAGYDVISTENIELTPLIQLGTFIDDYKNPSGEGFHWYFNINVNFSYKLTDKLKLFIEPEYDYSRWNTPKDVTTNGQRIWIDIYSFTTNFGIKLTL